MPDSTKNNLQKELLTIKWETKDSVPSTKEFIEQAKTIVSKYLKGTELLDHVLPDLAKENGSTDAIILYNLPLDPYIPPTPSDGSVSLKKPTHVAEAILLAIGELGGTAKTVGYMSEKHYSNPWVHEGFPRKGKVSALTNIDQVPHHQDMSYQTKIPDLLGLICLREGQDTEVQTTILDTTTLSRQLPTDVVSILRQKRFRIAAPTDWVDIDGVDLSILRPVLEGKSLHLPVSWENMIGIDNDATNALDTLRQTLKEIKPIGIHMVDGMMVIFNNQKVIHARTPYKQVKFDGTDRVVYRSYFAKDLGDVESETMMI
jgi:L-asparagine oxygenase